MRGHSLLGFPASMYSKDKLPSSSDSLWWLKPRSKRVLGAQSSFRINSVLKITTPTKGFIYESINLVSIMEILVRWKNWSKGPKFQEK